MPLTVADVMCSLERLAPASWAEDWDRVGLQLGRPDRVLSGVVLAVDVTPSVVERARQVGAAMIVAHHPLLFTPVTEIRTDTPHGSLLADLLHADLSVYAAHTNLDCAPRVGPAAALAAALNLQEVRPLLPVPGEARSKLVTFLPEESLPAVRQALADAGAGVVGSYRECTFHTLGQGHFRAPAESHPTVGAPGVANQVTEARLEMVFPAGAEASVVRALLAAHPYEEPAFDLYRLAAPPSVAGLGRIGRLPTTASAEDLARLVAKVLDLGAVHLAGGAQVDTVALLPGSGSSAVQPALAAGAHALITGELGYHETTEAVASGLAVITAGHAESEALLLPALAAALREEFGAALHVTIAPPAPTWRCLAPGAG